MSANLTSPLPAMVKRWDHTPLAQPGRGNKLKPYSVSVQI